MSLKIKGSDLRFFLLYAALFALLLYSRLVNIGWGLPYPFHPDERNIGAAIMNLTCHMPGGTFADWSFWKECLNPKFFAYGQFTIYAGYLLVLASRIVTHTVGPVDFSEAIIAIRLISAFASIATVWVALRIVKMLSDSRLVHVTAYLALIFSPAAIQFAHFGTTESLLMLCYTLLVYLSLRFVRSEIPMSIFAGACGLVLGVAAGAKISSLLFGMLPVLVFLAPRAKRSSPTSFKERVAQLGERVIALAILGTTTVAVWIMTSFYTIVDLYHALGAIDYESAVALGTLEVFYTRSFAYTTPVLYQFLNVFPFALGWVITIFFLLGFFLLPWKREYIVIRIAFLLYFIPTVGMFTKWTRFMAPVFPLMIIIAVGMLFHIYTAVIRAVSAHPTIGQRYKAASLFADSLFFTIMIAFIVIPGYAYLTIYQTPDVRYRASEWIFENVKPDAYILQETANVVDIPIPSPDTKEIPQTNYKYFSFNFYDVDADPTYQPQLREHIKNADYIFVPSRRIFANHTCMRRDPETCKKLQQKYPVLNEYYSSLFSGRLGFKEVAVFTSYPRIELFGKILIEFPDEVAEETWTVFDHPVIRIYKRN